MTLRVSDWQSEYDLGSIRNSCEVYHSICFIVFCFSSIVYTVVSLSRKRLRSKKDKKCTIDTYSSPNKMLRMSHTCFEVFIAMQYCNSRLFIKNWIFSERLKGTILIHSCNRVVPFLVLLRWNFNSYLFPALFFIFNICSLYTWFTGTCEITCGLLKIGEL